MDGNGLHLVKFDQFVTGHQGNSLRKQNFHFADMFNLLLIVSAFYLIINNYWMRFL